MTWWPIALIIATDLLLLVGCTGDSGSSNSVTGPTIIVHCKQVVTNSVGDTTVIVHC